MAKVGLRWLFVCSAFYVRMCDCFCVCMCNLFICNIRTDSALLSSVAEQRGERTQAEIIVILLRELLHCQTVECEHFLS